MSLNLSYNLHSTKGLWAGGISEGLPPLSNGTADEHGLAPAQRTPFFVHVDEFQSFATEAFAGLLSEARKFATHLCLANQYTDQLAPGVRATVLGNAGAMLVFRVSGADAELLVPEFDQLPTSELVDQPPFQAWIRRGIGHQHVELLPPPACRFGAVRAQSRRNFGRARQRSL